MALSVAVGMLMGAAELIPAGPLLCAAACGLVITGLIVRTRIAGLLTLCCIALVSACRFSVSSLPLSGAAVDRLRPMLPLEETHLIGSVIDEPVRRNHRTGNGALWILPVRCEGVMADGRWKRCRGPAQVCVTGAGNDEHFSRGQRILFTGTLQKRKYPGGDPVELIVGSFDARQVLNEPPAWSPFIWGQRLRQAAAEALGDGIEQHGDQVAVYRALLLGYRREVPDHIYRKFRRTGTLHIFAISGLHVGIAGLLLTLVLKSVGIPRNRWGLWLIPLLGGYVWMTGMKTSALRALTMAAVFFIAPLLRRRPDIPTSIAFAAIVLLWCKPAEITSVGFIFSFIVVSFIVMFFAAVPDRVIFRGSGWARGGQAYAVSLGITSWAAFVASLPVTALFFGTFTTVSLAGNLIVVPLTFGIVLSGWLAMLIPPASVIFNHSALVFINGLIGTVDLLSRIPGGHVRIPPPPLAALLFWYGGWIYLFTHARSLRQRREAFTLIVAAVVLCLIRSSY